MHEMAEADRLTIAGGTAGIDLMEKAGRAVADAVARRPLGTRIVVVAGPGNNGGDGFVAARLLADRGYPVRVMLVGEASKLKGDAATRRTALEPDDRAGRAGALAPAGLVVDALFGAGLERPVEGVARAMIEAMNAAGAPIVAVDLPSGINGSSGAVMGAAVNATESVTFFRRKPGHLLLPGRLHCGRVTVADIGIPASVLGTIRPADLPQSPGPLGCALSRCRASTGTNMPAAMRSWCRAALLRPGRRGWRRAGRCGQGRVSSPSPRRAMRSRSMRRQTSRSWCGRSMAPRR